MKQIFNRLRRVWAYIVLLHKFKKATRQADKKAGKNGKTYYVVKGPQKSLVVLTAKQYRRLATKGRAKPMTKSELDMGCYYCTSWQGGKLPHDKALWKRRAYFLVFMPD